MKILSASRVCQANETSSQAQHKRPKPFNPVTTLRHDLPEQSHVTLVIYNLLGREIRMLVNHMEDPGYRSVTWDATNDAGQPVGAGIYLYRIQAGSYTKTHKMILLK